MATGNILTVRFTRIAAFEPILPNTDQGGLFVYYDIPDNAPLPQADSIYEPLRFGYTRYTGNVADLLTDCGIAGPEPGGPTWLRSSLPGATPGVEYLVDVLISDAQSFDGSPASLIQLVEASAWLTGSSIAGTNGLRLRGTPPANETMAYAKLRAFQADGKSTDKTFNFAIGSAQVYAYFKYYGPENRLFTFIGAGSASQPQLSLAGPSGWTDTATYNAPAYEAEFGALKYFFRYTEHRNLVAGKYIATIKHLGKTVYGALTLTLGTDSEGIITLTPDRPVDNTFIINDLYELVDAPITETSRVMNGPGSIPESSSTQYSLIVNKSNGSTEDRTALQFWYLYDNGVQRAGETVTDGLVAISGDAITGNTRNRVLRAVDQETGVVVDKPVTIVDTSSANPPPTAKTVPNQTVTAGGAQTYDYPADTFFDTDALTVTASRTDNSALPTGISFNPANRRFTIGANVFNGSYPLRLRATDTANQSVTTDFTITVNRVVSLVIAIDETFTIVPGGDEFSHTVRHDIRMNRAGGVEYSFANNFGQYPGWFPATAQGGTYQNFQSGQCGAPGTTLRGRFRPADNLDPAAVVEITSIVPNASTAKRTIYSR